jgi:hypothetical protein
MPDADADPPGDDGAEAAAKRFLLRLDARTYDELRAWAEQDMRSVNGQILFLLTDALRRRKRGGDQGNGGQK